MVPLYYPSLCMIVSAVPAQVSRLQKRDLRVILAEPPTRLGLEGDFALPFLQECDLGVFSLQNRALRAVKSPLSRNLAELRYQITLKAQSCKSSKSHSALIIGHLDDKPPDTGWHQGVRALRALAVSSYRTLAVRRRG